MDKYICTIVQQQTAMFYPTTGSKRMMAPKESDYQKPSQLNLMLDIIRVPDSNRKRRCRPKRNSLDLSTANSR